MADKGTYKVSFRRRREGKTNYKKRLSMLKSGVPRFVVRKTNKHIIGQVIKFEPDGDKTLIHVNSKQLEQFGWKIGKKNLPASYLTGLLTGRKAKEKGIGKALLDIGFSIPKHKGWWSSALKGFLDSGVEIAAGKEVLPLDERASGKHIEAYSKKPVVKMFEEVKSKIMQSK